MRDVGDWGELWGFLDGFYSLGRRGFSRKSVGIDRDQWLQSTGRKRIAFARGFFVTSTSSTLIAGSLDISYIPQLFNASRAS